MNTAPEQRRRRILDWLKEDKSLPIDELVARLGVSVMTVHRDLDLLAKDGLLHKTYGHVTVVERQIEPAPSGTACALCHSEVPHRTVFTVQMPTGEHLDACCPHCGLLLLPQVEGFVSALTRDFIYGRMINVMQAIYVVESRVQLCCVPSVLCLTTLDDAQSFVRGFGGQIMDVEAACTYLHQKHCHLHAH